jgi:hypothetical protein
MQVFSLLRKEVLEFFSLLLSFSGLGWVLSTPSFAYVVVVVVVVVVVLSFFFVSCHFISFLL